MDMKAFLLILALAITVQAQKLKSSYDRPTDLTVVVTKEVTAWKPSVMYRAIVDPLKELKMRAYCVHKGHDKNQMVMGGLVFVFESTSSLDMSQLFAETVFVYADGSRYSYALDKGLIAHETWLIQLARLIRGGDGVMTAQMPWDELVAVLKSSDVEIRLGDKAFKLDRKKLENLIPILEYRPGSQGSAVSDPSATSPNTQSSRSPSSLGKTPDQKAYGLTLEGYNYLRIGMSYSQVVKLIGEEGVETMSSGGTGRSRMTIYRWDSKVGSGIMMVTFEDGKLTHKVQVGLP